MLPPRGLGVLVQSAADAEQRADVAHRPPRPPAASAPPPSAAAPGPSSTIPRHAVGGRGLGVDGTRDVVPFCGSQTQAAARARPRGRRRRRPAGRSPASRRSRRPPGRPSAPAPPRRPRRARRGVRPAGAPRRSRPRRPGGVDHRLRHLGRGQHVAGRGDRHRRPVAADARRARGRRRRCADPPAVSTTMSCRISVKLLPRRPPSRTPSPRSAPRPGADRAARGPSARVGDVLRGRDPPRRRRCTHRAATAGDDEQITVPNAPVAGRGRPARTSCGARSDSTAVASISTSHSGRARAATTSPVETG